MARSKLEVVGYGWLAMSPRLQAISFTDISGWEGEDYVSAFNAFCVSARQMAVSPYKTRSLGIDSEILCRIAHRALDLRLSGSAAAKEFFESNFIPHRIDEVGFLTGFYEPKVLGSKTRTSQFSYPLYGLPSDLVKGECYPYDRGEIQTGILSNKNLECAYVAEAIEAYFIHIQGCAHLVLPDGKSHYLTFAGKTGHDYTSLGMLLSKKLNMDYSKMTADFLKDWMYSNISDLENFLSHNRSYIFFKRSDVGAIGAAKVSMVPERSLAIDHTLHTFGVPIWLCPDSACSVKPRLTISHDTGSAIVGVARGDIFMGSGDAAGLSAGRISHNCEFIVFLPRGES